MTAAERKTVKVGSYLRRKSKHKYEHDVSIVVARVDSYLVQEVKTEPFYPEVKFADGSVLKNTKETGTAYLASGYILENLYFSGGYDGNGFDTQFVEDSDFRYLEFVDPSTFVNLKPVKIRDKE